MLTRVLVGVGAATVVAGVSTVVLYRRDMATAHERVRGHSQLISSPHGDIEFSTGGSGPPVLVVHGSGGGFDQGELMVRAVLGDQVHWIAPSRFGYLRSTFREGATFDAQADAYAYLLDHLGIDRAAVVALSHGGPSALLFAEVLRLSLTTQEQIDLHRRAAAWFETHGWPEPAAHHSRLAAEASGHAGMGRRRRTAGRTSR